MEEKYEFICHIERGGYGEVNKIKNKRTGAVRAMKIISKDKCNFSGKASEEHKKLLMLVRIAYMYIVVRIIQI